MTTRIGHQGYSEFPAETEILLVCFVMLCRFCQIARDVICCQTWGYCARAQLLVDHVYALSDYTNTRSCGSQISFRVSEATYNKRIQKHSNYFKCEYTN